VRRCLWIYEPENLKSFRWPRVSAWRIQRRWCRLLDSILKLSYFDSTCSAIRVPLRAYAWQTFRVFFWLHPRLTWSLFGLPMEGSKKCEIQRLRAAPQLWQRLAVYRKAGALIFWNLRGVNINSSEQISQDCNVRSFEPITRRLKYVSCRRQNSMSGYSCSWVWPSLPSWCWVIRGSCDLTYKITGPEEKVDQWVMVCFQLCIWAQRRVQLVFVSFPVVLLSFCSGFAMDRSSFVLYCYVPNTHILRGW